MFIIWIMSHQILKQFSFTLSEFVVKLRIPCHLDCNCPFLTIEALLVIDALHDLSETALPKDFSNLISVKQVIPFFDLVVSFFVITLCRTIFSLFIVILLFQLIWSLWSLLQSLWIGLFIIKLNWDYPWKVDYCIFNSLTIFL